MHSWDSAGDKIKRRSPEEVISSIGVQTPFAFDPGRDLSDVPDFIDAAWLDIEGQPNAVIELPGRDMNFARDSIITLYKLFHLLDCAIETRDRGRLTWSLVETYHVALLACRSIFSMYGVMTYTVRGRTVLVDYRPELGSVDEARAFRREHKGASEPVRILRPNKQLMEQRESWSLLKRLADITNGAEAGKARAATLATFSSTPITLTRNKILYDSVYWTWRTDFVSENESRKSAIARFSSNDQAVVVLTESLSFLISCCRELAKLLCAKIGFPLERLPRSAHTGAEILSLAARL